MPSGTINPSGQPGVPVEGHAPPIAPENRRLPFTIDADWTGGDAPVPAQTPEQIAAEEAHNKRHAEGIERQRAAKEIERQRVAKEKEFLQAELDEHNYGRGRGGETGSMIDDAVQEDLINRGEETNKSVKQAELDFDSKYVQDDLFSEAGNKKAIDSINGPDDLDNLLNEINEKDLKPKKGGPQRRGLVTTITKEDIMAAGKGLKNAQAKVRTAINQNPGSAKAGLLLSLLALAGSSVGDSWDWSDLISSDAWAGADISGAFIDAGKAMLGMDTTGSIVSNYAIPGMTAAGMDKDVFLDTLLNFPGEFSRGAKDVSQALLVNPLVSMQQGMGGRRLTPKEEQAGARNRRIPAPSSSGYGTPMAR